MKIVQLFKTDDGKTFEKRDDARKHEVEQEALGKLRNLLKASINSQLVRTGNVDNVLINILTDAAAVSEILLSFRKKQPKDEAKKAA